MDLKRKYAKLLLQGLKVEDKKYLFISLPSFLSEFKELLLDEAKAYNLKEVYVEETDVFKKHDLMKNLDQENIYKHPMFDRSIYNKYAKLDAAFLFIQSMVPNLMDDIDAKKISDTTKYMRKTQKYFRDLYETDKLNWCIAGVPNEYWAKNGLNMSLDELWDIIYKVCLVDENSDPYVNWNNKFDMMMDRTNKLNDYHFEYLHYKNSLGTDLKVYLPDGHIWCSGRGSHGEICNLPTEELFTSPLWNKTEGIVYSTKPLFYNNVLIEDFYLKFENGKVVDFDAKVGKEVLETIINNDEYSSYLGECALVSFDSPINNTGIVFKETLYDENASCHLALGMGFSECIKDSEDKTKEELRGLGVNDANIHVDFMIGNKDLNIIGVTYDGKKIDVIRDGNIVL